MNCVPAHSRTLRGHWNLSNLIVIRNAVDRDQCGWSKNSAKGTGTRRLNHPVAVAANGQHGPWASGLYPLKTQPLSRSLPTASACCLYLHDGGSGPITWSVGHGDIFYIASARCFLRPRRLRIRHSTTTELALRTSKAAFDSADECRVRVLVQIDGTIVVQRECPEVMAHRRPSECRSAFGRAAEVIAHAASVQSGSVDPNLRGATMTKRDHSLSVSSGGRAQPF